MAASKVIIDALLNIFPGDQVDLSGESLKLNQSDVFFTAMAPPVAVVFPTAVAQVQDLIKSAGEVGFSIAPKGAGLSYSDGYIPHNAHTVIVDMCKLNQIMEINERDRYVTVQPGVTWEQLHDALAKTGLRTPFWGTFSGKYATIGGAVSQGAKFFGSGNQGSVAESVLSLDVVIGDGSLVSTGSAATPHNPSPFYRYYGPDLTGLFLGDCGAYGIKTRLTLQLIPAPQSIKTASFSFQSAADMIGAMTEIGAQKLASECFALDPFLVNLRMKFEGLGEDLESLQKVFAAQRSLVSGITELASMALHGRRFIKSVGFLMSAVTEGGDTSEADTKMAKVLSIVKRHTGSEVPNSLPKVIRASPFRKINRLLGPQGERIVWFHAMVPNSRAIDLYLETEKVFDLYASEIEAFKLRYGYLISVNGPSTFGLEPIIYFEGQALPIHTRYIDPEHFEKLPKYPHSADALQAVFKIREAIIGKWSELGATHLQIGRTYPYLSTRTDGSRSVLNAIKLMFDPLGIFNPGVLEK